jgi:diamine N-acetyltransferase
MKIITAEPHHAMMLYTFAAKTFYDAWKEFNTEEDMQLFVMQHFTPEIISQEIEDVSQVFLLAMNKETLAGYLKLKMGKPEKYDLTGTCFEIEKLYVDKDLQNQQTGTLLLKDAEREAKERKGDTLWLSVWKPNERAIKFYERNGFSIFGEQEFVLGKDVQYDFLMRKDLV